MRSVTVHHQDAMVTYANSSASLADLTIVQSFVGPVAMMAGMIASKNREQALAAHRRALERERRLRAQERASKGKGGRRELAAGSTVLSVQTRIRKLDTNGNVMLEENELETGFMEMLARQEESHTMLLRLFDDDGDGELGEKEGQAVRGFLFGLAGTLLYDPNRDWKLDDPEADKAWDEWAEAYERHNDHVLQKFDRNRDGELSREEATTARKQFGK